MNLEAENSTLLDKVNELTLQLQQLSVSCEPEKSDNNGDPVEGLSDDAIRKRLMRICSKRQDGILGIHCFRDYVLRIAIWSQWHFMKPKIFSKVFNFRACSIFKMFKFEGNEL